MDMSSLGDAGWVTKSNYQSTIYMNNSLVQINTQSISMFKPYLLYNIAYTDMHAFETQLN